MTFHKGIPWGRGASTLAWLALISGCISSPESQVEQVQVDVPESWAHAANASSFDPQGWMTDFNDPQLEAILQEALARNFGLMAAQARMEGDIAGTVFNQAGFWPNLNLTTNKSESRRSAATGIQQTPVSKTYSLNGRFNWEIDLWGELRNGYRGDLADAESAMADFEATRLSIAGRTAQAWYNAIETEQQLDLAQRTLDAYQASQQVVEEGFDQGIGSALDVRLIRANVASAASSYELRLRNREAAARTLEVLLGRYPTAELAVRNSWPEIQGGTPAGLPADLLLRRPDIIAVERDLAAAEQRKYETRKAMLPNLSLTLTRGTNDREVDNLFNLDARRVWSRVWNVSQPLFQGRRLQANARRMEARHRQAVANYTNAVLGAFKEVEDALTDQDSYDRDFEFQQVATEESIAAAELAWEQYESGLVGITTVLDSERRSITAQRSLIQTINRRLQSRIQLYLALGGGFTFDEAPREN